MTEVMERPMSKVRNEDSPKLLQKDLRMSEHARAHFDVTLPVGMPFEEVLKPLFWSNVAGILARKPGLNEDMTGAIIDVGTQDHAFFAQLYVRVVYKQSLDVAVLTKPVYFGPQEDAKSKMFETRWNIGSKGFDIIRKTDRAIVGRAQDFKKKEDALAWIKASGG